MTMSPVAEVAVVVVANGLVALAITYWLHSAVAVGGAAAFERWGGLSATDRVRLWRLALFSPCLTAPLHLTLAPEPTAVQLDVAAITRTPLVDPMVALVVVGLALIPMATAFAGVVRDRVQFWQTFRGRRDLAGPVRDRLDDLIPVAGLPAVRLTASDRLVSPVAIGRSEICVPARVFAAMASDEQRALLAHELGHLARRDPMWLSAASLALRLGAIQPLNRVAVRRHRIAMEHAADDFALGATGNALALVRALTTVASLVLVVAGAVPASGSPIVGRVERLLARRQRPPRWPRRVVAVCAIAVLAIVLAGHAPGVSMTPDRAANRIGWLAPSREDPNPRMLEFRRVTRAFRDATRQLFR